ncbi:MAG: transporter substrate-binding domain-containing protein [Prevotella sp.]|nr:transporter substrate-binding domain-containing protein [Prevotella sp.]
MVKEKTFRDELGGLLAAMLLTFLAPLYALAQEQSVEQVLLAKYTKERPLIYEGAQDLWPYSFLNDNGQPDGFNIDLMKLLLGKLRLPYEIRMKPRMMAFSDLKQGQSDLMIGLTAGFHEKYGYYSENPVTLFTQSILSPKSNPTQVRNFRDLAHHRVLVNDSSLCHHLMVDYGWGGNAIPTRNIAETVMQMSTEEQGELVWNTLSLKWLLRKFQIDNLEITPVDMPHGEYKFISSDSLLIHALDSVFTQLSSSDQLLPLQNKWFYPERQEKTTPLWVWYTIGGSGLLLLILLFYTIVYQLQARTIRRNNAKDNRRLALILETSGVRMWTYDIATKMFTWRNEFGQPAYVYTVEEFAQRYSPEDFQRLRGAIQRLSGLLPKEGGKEEEITLNIKAKDAREDGDTEMHDFVIVLSVLRRNEKNVPVELIGIKKDVTQKREAERKGQEQVLHYWAIFETPMVGILFFDNRGFLTNLNQKACQMLCCDRAEILAERPSFNAIFDLDGLPLSEADGFHATLMVDLSRIPQHERKVLSAKFRGKLYSEYRLVRVDDEEGKPLGLFAFCINLTYVARSQEAKARSIAQLHTAKDKESEYIHAIDNFLHNGDTRTVSYSPERHVLTIYSASEQVQHALTPTRLMTLVDDRMTNKAIRLLSNMDERVEMAVDTDIRTTLRVRGGHTLHLHLHLLPQLDAHGVVQEYMGVLRDISELKASEQRLAQVELKNQEIEDTKSAFIRNMMSEIRTPMDQVIESAARLMPQMTEQEEQPIASSIVQNAELLTQIIDNILYLSRIEAHMVEIQKRPTDFAQIFESHCRNGWEKYRNAGVRYTVENPYEQLVIDIDGEHLGNIITQVTRNAAQHTTSGMIRARYDYIGRRLMISVEDTGTGMSADQLRELNAQLEAGTHTSNGLGLAICKELIKQMGGNIEIYSEPGLGTTVWIILPCQATNIKRKKIL